MDSYNLLCQNTKNWTLHHDAKLLSCLEALSSKIISAVEEAQQKLTSLSTELRRAEVSFDNVVNDLSVSSNHQFIENRVYDEDTIVAKKQEIPASKKRTKEEEDAATLEALKFGLDRGIEMIGQYFTRIDVKAEDFDESDDPTFKPEPIYRPKSSYANRRLPYLIGTELFRKSRYVGLADDAPIATKQANINKQVVDLPADKIERPSKSRQEDNIAISLTIPPADSKDGVHTSTSRDSSGGNASDNSGLFSSSIKSDTAEPAIIPKTSQIDFQANLNAKLAQLSSSLATRSEPKTVASGGSNDQNRSQAHDYPAAMEKPAPKEMEKPKLHGQVQSSLADQQQKFDNLFGQSPPPLFDNDSEEDEDLFSAALNANKKPARGLFDEPSSDEAPCFSPTPETYKYKSPAEQEKQQDVKEKTVVQQQSFKPDSIFQKSYLQTQQSKSKLFDDSDDDDLFAPKSITDNIGNEKIVSRDEILQNTKTMSTGQNVNMDAGRISKAQDQKPYAQQKKGGLFVDEDGNDEALFVGQPKKTEVNESRSQSIGVMSKKVEDSQQDAKCEQVSAKPTSLFDDSSDDDSDLFKPRTSKSPVPPVPEKPKPVLTEQSKKPQATDSESQKSSPPEPPAPAKKVPSPNFENKQKLVASALQAQLAKQLKLAQTRKDEPPEPPNVDNETSDSVQPESSHHFLDSLQKGRVKLPPSRRPPSAYRKKPGKAAEDESSKTFENLSKTNVASVTTCSAEPEQKPACNINESSTSKLPSDPLNETTTATTSVSSNITVEQTQKQRNADKPKGAATSIWDDDSDTDDIFSSNKSTIITAAKENTVDKRTIPKSQPVPGPKTKSLFDDDDDDDGDIFGSRSSNPPVKSPNPVTSKETTALLKESISNSEAKDVPKGSTSATKMPPSSQASSKTKSLFDDSDSDIDIFK